MMKKVNIEILLSNGDGEINSTAQSTDGTKGIVIFASMNDINYIPKYLMSEFSGSFDGEDTEYSVTVEKSDGVEISDYQMTRLMDSIVENCKIDRDKINWNLCETYSDEHLDEAVDDDVSSDIASADDDLGWPTQFSETETEEDDEKPREKINTLVISFGFFSNTLSTVSKVNTKGVIKVAISTNTIITQWGMIQNELIKAIIDANFKYDFNESIVVEFFIADPFINPIFIHMAQMVTLMASNSLSMMIDMVNEEDDLIMYKVHFGYPIVTNENGEKIRTDIQYHPEAKPQKNIMTFDDFIASVDGGGNDSPSESYLFSSDFSSSVYQNKKKKKKKK